MKMAERGKIICRKGKKDKNAKSKKGKKKKRKGSMLKIEEKIMKKQQIRTPAEHKQY